MRALLVAALAAACAVLPANHPCSEDNPEAEAFLRKCEACPDQACVDACELEWARRCEQ